MSSFGRTLAVSVLHWIPLATLTVLIAGMVYVAVQQDERAGANDPQIQMAVDARNALVAGATPQSLVPANQVDIARSLAPYLVIFDGNRQEVAASATINGLQLVPPAGVFDSAQALPMDTITWTPAPGVRSAIVVLHYANGYVLAGRSLATVEDRENQTLWQVGVAGVVTLVLTYLAVLITTALMSRISPARPGV
jgi:hypothetical protein